MDRQGLEDSVEQRTAVSRAAPKLTKSTRYEWELSRAKKLVTAEMGIQILMIQLRNAKAGVKRWAISTSVSLWLASHYRGCNYIRYTIL